MRILSSLLFAYSEATATSHVWRGDPRVASYTVNGGHWETFTTLGQPAHTPEMMFDGDKNTVWIQHKDRPKNDDAEIHVAFVKPVEVENVRLTVRQDCCKNRYDNVCVVYEDGVGSVIERCTIDSLGYIKPHLGYNNGDEIVFKGWPGNDNVQKVRVEFRNSGVVFGDNYAQVAEFAIDWKGTVPKCDPNWSVAMFGISNHRESCDDWRKLGWCSGIGGAGNAWEPLWGKVTDHPNEEGVTVDVCPQCGCVETDSQAKTHMVMKNVMDVPWFKDPSTRQQWLNQMIPIMEEGWKDIPGTIDWENVRLFEGSIVMILRVATHDQGALENFSKNEATQKLENAIENAPNTVWDSLPPGAKPKAVVIEVEKETEDETEGCDINSYDDCAKTHLTNFKKSSGQKYLNCSRKMLKKEYRKGKKQATNARSVAEDHKNCFKQCSTKTGFGNMKKCVLGNKKLHKKLVKRRRKN